MNNNIDLFNISSEFYNDRFSFNYKNNDFTINDRIKYIYSIFKYVKPIVF